MLVVGRLSDLLLLFYSDIAKFSGIKDFSAGLAFNELGILVSGNNLYDGVFASSCHVWGV